MNKASATTAADTAGQGGGNWLDSPQHQAWTTDQALRLLAFYRGSVDGTGRFVELDDDGRPLPGGSPPSPNARQNLLTVTRVVHSYALGEMLGIPGCRRVVDRGLTALWDEHRDPVAYAATHLIDHERGGWYPQLDPTNRPKVHPSYGKPDIYHLLQACLLPILPVASSVVGAIRRRNAARG